MSELRSVDAALRDARVPFLVVKGPALVHQYYDSIELRSFVDLDIVVRPRDLSRALVGLEGASCELLDANWPLLSSRNAHELRVVGPTGGAIDLHWSLGYGPGSERLVPSVDALLERGTVADLGGVESRVLDWADTIVHLALHAASSGGHRLIWCADLRAALGAMPPGGARLLVERATEWGAAPALHLMLWRAHHALRMPLSPELMAALSPSPAWSSFVRLVERAAPVARSGPGPSLTRIVARSAGPDARSSWKALRSKGILAIRGRGPQLSPAELHDPSDPRSGLYSAGGTPGRRAFLARVTGAVTDDAGTE